MFTLCRDYRKLYKAEPEESIQDSVKTIDNPFDEI